MAASRAKKRQKAAKKTSKAKRRKKKKRRAAEGSSDDDAAEKEADGSVEAEAGSSDDYSGSESESESDGEGSEASSASKKGARSGAGLVPPGVVFSRVFKWQEKAFSPWELMRYHSMCRADRLSENGRLLPESATGNNEEYREEMEEWLKEGLDPLSLLQPAMLFSYVDNDGFIPESERDEVTTDSAPPLLVAEMVTPVEHYRAKSRRGFIDEDVHRAVHADRGMVAQTMYIMAAVEIDTESFKRTAEDHAVQQPLCMIRAFPSSTRVDMQPRFSKAPIVIPALMRGGAAGAPAAAPAAGGAEGADSAEQQQSARVEWYRFSTARGVYEYRVENNSGPTAGVYPQFVRPVKAEIAPSGGAGAAEAASEDAAAREAKEAADRATGLVDLLNFDAKRVASDTKREVQLRELASLLDEEDHRRDREATASMIARTAAPFRGPVHANECHIFCNVELMSASGYAGGVERMYVMAETVLPPIGWKWPRISATAVKGKQEVPDVLVDRMKHGCTHVAEVSSTGVAHFGHPIDLELWWRPREDARVAQITFHVYAVDSYQRHRVIGYGFYNVPTTPTTTEVTVRTWNPNGQTIESRVHEALVGGVKTLNDSGFVGMPRRRGDSELVSSVSRYGFASTASGVLKLRVNSMIQYSPTFGRGAPSSAAAMLASAFGGGAGVANDAAGGAAGGGKLRGLIKASSRKAKVQRRDVKDIMADYGMEKK